MGKNKKKQKTQAEKASKAVAIPGSAESLEQVPAQPVQSQSAARLAQIVNLTIAGYSLEDIGTAIGATAAEVDEMIQRDAARYVRNQPQLRVHTRRWIGERYTKLLDAVWDDASNPTSPRRFDAQDRAMRTLDSMRKLYGADAPTQTEVKVDAAPEAVEALVQALSKNQGLGYDVDVFDVVEAEVIHETVEQAEHDTEVSGNAVGDPAPGDEDWSDSTEGDER